MFKNMNPLTGVCHRVCICFVLHNDPEQMSLQVKLLHSAPNIIFLGGENAGKKSGSLERKKSLRRQKKKHQETLGGK